MMCLTYVFLVMFSIVITDRAGRLYVSRVFVCLSCIHYFLSSFLFLSVL